MADSENNSVTTALINQVEHDLEVVISNAGKRSNEIKFNMMRSMTISNDLLTQSMRIRIIYVDRGNSIATFYNANASTLLRVRITRKLTSDRRVFYAEFVIDAVRIVSPNQSEPIYEISGTHLATHELQRQIALFGDELTPTELLEQLFQKAKLNLSIDQGHRADNKELYISDTGIDMVSQIDRLCDLASGEKLGAFYIALRYLDGEFKSFSTKVERSDLSKDGIKTFTLTKTTSEINSDGKANLIDYSENDTGFDIYMARSLFSEKSIRSFDAIKRKWNKITITSDQVVSAFTNKLLGYKFAYDIPDWEKRSPLVKNDYYERDSSLFGFELRRAMIYSRMLTAKVIGDLSIDVGTFVIINFGGDLLEKYGGIWMVSRVEHQLERNAMVSIMTLSRAFDNSIDNKGGTNEKK